MNTITFQCSPMVTDTNQPTVEGRPSILDVAIRLDGGEPIITSVDLSGIIYGSAVEYAEFYLFTCDCGAAGCAGFHTPLTHTRNDTRIEWKIDDEKLKSWLGAAQLQFETKSFDAEIAKLRAEIEKFEQKNVFADTMLEDFYPHGEDSVTKGVTLKSIEERACGYYQGQTDLYKICKSIERPDDPKQVRYQYDNPHYTSEIYSASITDVACVLLNLGVSLDTPSEKAAHEISSVVNIIRKLVSTGDADAANKALKPFMTTVQLSAGGELSELKIDEHGPFASIH